MSYLNQSQILPPFVLFKIQEGSNSSQQLKRKQINNFPDDLKKKKKEHEIEKLLKTYELNFEQYALQNYTYLNNKMLMEISKQPQAQKIAEKFHLFKALRVIAKYLFFNEFEILFFSYILQNTNWQYDDPKIKFRAQQMKDFSEIYVEENLEFKQILLFLLLNGYAIKHYLNDTANIDMFEAKLEYMISGFQQSFTDFHKDIILPNKALELDFPKINDLFCDIMHKNKLSDFKSKFNNKNYDEIVNRLLDNEYEQSDNGNQQQLHHVTQNLRQQWFEHNNNNNNISNRIHISDLLMSQTPSQVNYITPNQLFQNIQGGILKQTKSISLEEYSVDDEENNNNNKQNDYLQSFNDLNTSKSRQKAKYNKKTNQKNKKGFIISKRLTDNSSNQEKQKKLSSLRGSQNFQSLNMIGQQNKFNQSSNDLHYMPSNPIMSSQSDYR